MVSPHHGLVASVASSTPSLATDLPMVSSVIVVAGRTTGTTCVIARPLLDLHPGKQTMAKAGTLDLVINNIPYANAVEIGVPNVQEIHSHCNSKNANLNHVQSSCP